MKEFFAKIKSGYRKLAERKYSTIAGTLTFFLTMSLAPLIFFGTFVFGRSTAIEQILELPLFDWAKDLILFFRDNAENTAKGVGLFFILTTVWSSTGFFFHLKKSGEILYGVRGKHSGKARLHALVMTGLLIVFAVAAVFVLVAGMVVFSRLGPFFYPLTYMLLFAVGFFAAAFLNLYLCPYRISFRSVALGSAATSAGWLLATIAFSVYFAFGSKERLYGALSVAICFLLWLYWLMLCFVIGAIFNCYHAQRLDCKHAVHGRQN